MSDSGLVCNLNDVNDEGHECAQNADKDVHHECEQVAVDGLDVDSKIEVWQMM